MSRSALLPSKLNPPAAEPHHVSRKRLTDRLTQPGPHRLVLVRAAAGFGKTTVMTQARQALRDSGMSTGWLTLDRADNDVPRFVAYLATAVQEVISEDQEPFGELSMSASEAAIALIDKVAAVRHPFVLFFDEMETIQSSGVLALVGQLVERLPAHGRLVIGSRAEPALKLARMRATGQLLDIDARDLRFSLEETRTYFAQRRVGAIASADVALLHGKTEGWVAALGLVWLALERNTRPHEFINAYSGTESGLAEYLAQEVLAQQEEPVRRFLLRTSILGEVSAALCGALLPDEDAESLLRKVSAAGSFLIPIEGEAGSWRYHSLFAGFLRAELHRETPGEVPVLHEAAAGAFLQQGRAVPAIEHLLAGGKTEAAVALLQEQAIPLLTQGRLRLLTHWFDLISPATLRQLPTVQVACAWALTYTRGPRAAMAMLDETGLTRVRDAEVTAHVAALQACLLIQLDRWEEAYEAARLAFDLLPGPSPYADAATVNVLAAASAAFGKFDETRRMLERARKSQGQRASEFHRMYSDAVEGIIDVLDGRLRQGQARFRLALQTSQSASSSAGHGNAWAGVLYASSVYETGNLRQAQQLLEVYVPLAREAWLPDHTIMGYVLLARMAFLAGDIDGAFERISELEYLGHERQLARLVEAARLERAWILLRQGHHAAANHQLILAGESPVWQEVAARRHLAHDWDDLDIARARWELMAGDSANALIMLEQLLAQAQSRGSMRRALKLRLLHAMALDRAGNGKEADARMLPLLREAAAEGAVRLFVDEGRAAGVLVLRARSRASITDPLYADYLQRLAADFGPIATETEDASDGLREPLEALSAKESRVLQLLAEGYSNDALAQKLFISNSTVRTHLRNINTKLGASNRTQAVAVGRRLRLIE